MERSAVNAKERPISPHLQIYKLPLVAILSVVHRLSGLALYFGLMAIIWAYFLATSNIGPGFIIAFCNKIVFNIPFFILWSGALYIHLCSGIRHLIWDLGKGLSLKTVRITNYMVIFIAAFLFIITWAFALL